MKHAEAAGVVVAFQGEHGAYSEAAARELFSGTLGEAAQGLSYQGLPQFSDVFDAVQKGNAMYGMIPVENTLGGSIHTNFDLILKCSDLHVVAEFDFHVQHCLIAPPSCSKSDIRLVMSHWQALAQCDGYLRGWGVETKVAYDTAGSAKMIKEQGLRGTAAIASELAAEKYGMLVLAKGIQDVQFNHTRFLLLSRESCAVVREPATPSGVKTTVIFWAPHTPGALFRAVSAFALRNLGVVKTESRPVSPQQWKELTGQILTGAGENQGPQAKYNYIFYLDVAAHAESEDMRNALDHLRELTPFVRILGPYPTGGSLTDDVICKTKSMIPPAPSVNVSTLQGQTIGLIGFGKFGQFLAKRLVENHQVIATSIEPELASKVAEMGCTWVPWANGVQEMLLNHRVEVLVLCTSIVSFAQTVNGLPFEVLKQAKPLVVDVLSVKTYAKEVMLQCIPEECDILCTHPMFGPESAKHGWHGLPFVFEIVRAQQSWERVHKFLGIFGKAGCRMVAMSCEEHDKQTAASQFITHLTGRVLAEHGCQQTPIDTVGYQNLCIIADHVCKDSFDLFYGLFKYNPNSMQQLCLLKRGIDEVERQLSERLEHERDGKIRRIDDAETLLHLSSTVQRISESKTAQIQALSKKLKEEGMKVNDALCIGEPGYPPPAEVLAALRAAPGEGHTRYTVVQGDVELRKAICEDLRRRKGVEYRPEHIVVSCGGKQAIYQAMLAICEAGDEILVPTPCWVSYHDIARLCGATPVPVETFASDGYILRPDSLASALEASGSRCRAVVLCNPSNPTGAVIPPAGLAAIADVLRRPEFAHVYVLSDEAFAMTGLRLGYLAAAHEGVASAAVKLQGQITSCASSVVQHAALAALRGGAPIEEWVTERVTELRAKRDLVLSRLRAMEGIECATPEGAFYVLPNLSKLFRPGSKVKSSEEFCCVLLKEHQVALVPGEAFHAPGTVRISYACQTSELEAGLDAFEACVRKVQLAS